MSLLFDIGQGAGLAGATGVRPFLPPLLAGALARGDTGVDFEGTDYSFLESPAFLFAVLAVAVVAYAIDRRPEGGTGAAPESAGRGRIGLRPFDLAVSALGLALGALLFAGSLADGDNTSWWGLLAGIACAALGFAAVALLFSRARRRVSGGAAALLGVYADLIALALAGLSILVPPVAFAALAVFAFLIVRARSERDRKFEGLRILR